MEPTYRNYATAAVAYAATVSALYLLAFWGSFRINVLEYVGFSDLLKNAAYPLLFSVPVLLLGQLVSELWLSDPLRRLFPPGGGADTTIGRAGRKYWKAFLGLYLLAIILGAIFGVSPQKWLGVAAMVAFLAFPLSKIEAIKTFIPSDRVRETVLMVGLFVAGYSYFDGTAEAWKIKKALQELEWVILGHFRALAACKSGS